MPPTLPGDRSAVVKPLTCPVVAATSTVLGMGPLFRPPRRNLLILALRVTGPKSPYSTAPSHILENASACGQWPQDSSTRTTTPCRTLAFSSGSNTSSSICNASSAEL